MKKLVPQLVTVGTGTEPQVSKSRVSNTSHRSFLNQYGPGLGVIEVKLSSIDHSFSCRRTSEGHAVHLLCARGHGKQQCHHIRQCQAAKFKGKRQISTKLQVFKVRQPSSGLTLSDTCAVLGQREQLTRLGDFTKLPQRSNPKGSRVHLVQL